MGEKQISLSSASDTIKTVSRNVGDFSTVDVLASSVNNRKFRLGYDDLAAGIDNERSYIWKALSAVSEDLGESLFSNVEHYIDNVSNVDTCKVKALKSMMSMLGINYIMLDKISYYPIEIQHLIDLLSINRKYLFNNQFMKQDFINALSVDEVIQLCNMIDPAALSTGNASSDIDYYICNDGIFNDYLSSVYYNFIDDMLNMHFAGTNSKLSGQAVSSIPIYTKLELTDGYGADSIYEDKYLYDKRDNNIDVSFNVEQTVNDIETGIESLDNFNGPKRTLLEKEIEYRKSPLTNTNILDLATRYNYYRKQKVIEYARFVDNMAIPLSTFTSQVMYDYDPNYFILSGQQSQNYCISGIGTDDVAILSADVEKAANSLTQITRYISKLREIVRLQVRKVFMKGTNNLLRYTVNEFLIDYIDYMKSNFDENLISDIITALSSHSLSSVEVQEYWDNTEYMNISCVTTKYSSNPDLVNDRYFDKAFYRENGLLVPYQNGAFTNEAINKFYLDQLNLNNTLQYVVPSADAANRLSSNFYEFLSVLFDIAANTSYYDSTGHFGMKLSNDTITQTIDADLLCTQTIYSNISSLADRAEFEFLSTQTVKTQLDNFQNAVYALLSNNYLSAVSSVYSQYQPNVNAMSSEFDSQVNALSTFLNVTYANYFCKSTNEYSYNEDGSYKYDYFVGNPAILVDTIYIQQLNAAYEWINAGNCKTRPVIDAIEQLSIDYDSTHSDIANMTSELTSDGFIDMNLPELGNEMDSVQSYLNSKIAARNEYLQNALDNLRTQAQDVKAAFDTIETSFAAALANMPDTTQGYYFTINQDVPNGVGGYRIVSGSEGLKTGETDELVYDSFSSHYFRKKGTGNKSIYVKAPFINTVPQTGSLATRLDKAKALIKECSNIFYGNVVNATVALSSTAGSASPRAHGTTEDTLNAIKANYTRVSSQIASIANQAADLFNLGTDSNSILYPATNTNIIAEDRIVNLIEILGTKITEKNFNDDFIMRSYNVQMSSLMQISSSYIPAKDEYEALWQKFSEFFNDYPKAGNYKSFTPDNISKVYDYTITKDSTALGTINAWFEDAIGQYESLVQQFTDMCNQGIYLWTSDTEQTKYEYGGSAIELALADFEKKLLLDVSNREQIGRAQLEAEYANVNEQVNAISYGTNPVTKMPGLYRKYFPDALGEYIDNETYMQKFYAQYVSFLALVKQIIDKLYYADNDEYVESQLMFQNYSGIPHIATDPYYNVKNQTHPSYQIHPLLWNFTEKHAIDQALDMISQTLTHINYDELESASIAKYLDTYIGEFGNLINVWKTHVNDFSGYKTRYESSDHISRYTNTYSPVVDYDGAFYPPALDEYLSSSTHGLMSISAYYDHLNVIGSSISSDIDSALKWNFSKISDIAAMHEAGYEYDIYKYCLDAYGNSYILYKKYDSDSLTQFEKSRIPGELWVKLADTPIAFPLSYVYGEDVIAGRSYDRILTCQICDIDMLGSGKKAIFTYLDDTTKQPMSVPLYIRYNLAEDAGIGKVVMYNFDIGNDSSEFQSSEFPKPLLIDTSSFWSYCGCYQIDASVVDVVYVKKNYEISNHTLIPTCIIDDPQIKIVTIVSDRPQEEEKTISLNGLSGIVGEQPAIAYHLDDANNRCINIAFATSSTMYGELATSNANLSVNTLSGADGSTFSNFSDDEMNSFDQFTTNIVMNTIRLSNVDDKLNHSFKMNSDMGYVPLYAYSEFENVLDSKTAMSNGHQAITLLGKSKDIGDLIDNANTSPDPYLSKEDIYSSKLYGRVYEYDENNQISPDKDNSLNIYSNMSMYQNMPNAYYGNQHFGFYGTSYVWDIILNDYTEEELNRQRLFMYNTKCLGRNPYIIENLSDVILSSEHLAEGEFLYAKYNDRDQDIGGCELSSLAYKTVVGGTLDGLRQVDFTYSNRINNISQVKYKFVRLGIDRYLQLVFDIEDTEAEGYILQDTLKTTLVDDLNIKFFEWYHYLDPGVTLDGAKQVFDQFNADPITKQQLQQIDLGEFSQLSDVSLSNGFKTLITDRRLQFKISEEDIYPTTDKRYYVPSLNVKYPMTTGQFYKDTYIDSAHAEAGIRLFEDDEIYVIDVQSESILSAIGNVAIELNGFNTVDEYRVDEEYFHIDSHGTLNCEKYPIDDPQFFQYVHFSEDHATGDPVDAPLNVVEDIRVGDNDAFSQFIATNGLKAMRSDEYIDWEYGTYTNFNYVDLDNDDAQTYMNRAKDLMRIYLTYKKTKSGIIIYANYQNYINSPFVKIVDGKSYIDTIPNTYAEIGPGENKLLNVIVQFRQYSGEDLIGVQNVIIATYQIFNVSDDKPKFIARRMNQAKPDQYKLYIQPYIALEAAQLSVDSQIGDIINYPVQLESNIELTSNVSCKLRYPSSNIEYVGCSNEKYVTKPSNGIVDCIFTDLHRVHMIQFKVKQRTGVNIMFMDIKYDYPYEMGVQQGIISFT